MDLTTEVEYNGEEVTVEVTFTPGWYRRGCRSGHPDNWTPDEGESAEVHKIELEGEGDITLKLGKDQLERVQKVCDQYEPEAPEPDYDDRDDYDDFDPNIDCGTDSNGRDRDYGKY